jgi:hypothetical protein
MSAGLAAPTGPEGWGGQRLAWYKDAMITHMSRWGEYGARPEPLAENAALFGALVLTETVAIGCEPWQAYQLVSSIERIGEFSPECVTAQWLGEATGPAVGARFEGTNRVVVGEDEVVWIRPCTVTGVTEGEYFAYVVGDRYDGSPATQWEFLIEATAGGCVVTQSFRHFADGLSGLRGEADANPEMAAAILSSRVESLQAGMRQTLARMRTSLELTTTSVESEGEPTVLCD